MLHVFHVDLGAIYTFEMELAMERWEDFIYFCVARKADLIVILKIK